MTTPESPAALLRRAADRLDETAAATSPEPWRGHIRDALVPWVALMSIEVAPHLSSWLRLAASDAERTADMWPHLDDDETRERMEGEWFATPLNLARTLLGETEETS